jgi:hypothetical protein
MAFELAEYSKTTTARPYIFMLSPSLFEDTSCIIAQINSEELHELFVCETKQF